jgi:hypothetical protein
MKPIFRLNLKARTIFFLLDREKAKQMQPAKRFSQTDFFAIAKNFLFFLIKKIHLAKKNHLENGENCMAKNIFHGFHSFFFISITK